MAWQLINTKTNEVLHGPGPLPENWGPICGVAGFLETHGDLSLLGEQYADMAWVEVDDPEPEDTAERDARAEVRRLLSESDWAMLPDAEITVGERQEWVKYRKALRRVKRQRGFPHKIKWPVSP